MRKSFLALFMAMGLVAAANAQDQQEATSEEAAVANASESINHWSLAVKGGINYLRNADQKVDFEIGGVVERTFNPRWGLGIEYMYLKNKNEAMNGYGEMDGYNHDIDIFGSINMSNIIAPYRSAGWQKLNWYVNGGLGVSLNVKCTNIMKNVDILKEKLNNNCSNLIRDKENQLDRIKSRDMIRNPYKILLAKEHRQQELIAKLEALNPILTLKRGYAYARKDGKIVSKAADLKKGDNLKLTFDDGNVNTKVID